MRLFSLIGALVLITLIALTGCNSRENQVAAARRATTTGIARHG